jgi:hypothetical protein
MRGRAAGLHAVTADPLRGELHHDRPRHSRPVSVMFVSILVLALLPAAVLFGYSLNTMSTAGAKSAAGYMGAPAQRGFALPTWQEDGYDSPQVEQAYRDMVEVGATWVQLAPTWYQETRDSDEIVRTSMTVSDAGLERAIALAHQHGLEVFLKPHLDLPNPGQDSRNNIRPDDPEAWFASYTTFISHYVEIAEQMGVEQFAVGTELSSVQDDRAAWLKVIQAVRARYHGSLTYAANGDNYEGVPFWDAVDVIGIDAYWPLSGASTTDVSLLQRSWEPIRTKLAALSAKYHHKILFTEAGYTSQDGTTTNPSDWRLSTTQNETEQAAAYQALLATFSDQEWWAGVYWWVWEALPDTAYDPLDFSPHGKAAEWAIRGWWAK